MRSEKKIFLAICGLTAGLAASAQAKEPTKEGSFASTTQKIKEESERRSEVMKTLSRLTDVIGPRLTGSPGMRRANEWTRDRLAAWGLANAHLEAWGPFGRGWSLKRFSAQVVSPRCIPLIAYPKAWSDGTDGPIVGEVVHFDATEPGDFDRYQGKLKGKIVLVGKIRELSTKFEPEATRLTDTNLLHKADAVGPAPGLSRMMLALMAGQERSPDRKRGTASKESNRARKTAAKRTRAKFIADEGAAAILDNSFNGRGGTLFVDAGVVTGDGDADHPWENDAPESIPQITLATEYFNSLVRMIDQGEKPSIALDLQVEFHDKDLTGYNTVAEIPGTDLKDEVVMLGGHMDSWHSATGATDNAAGVAVAMEAVRILQALGLTPRRTIRIALWSGEEQGLKGSRGYVARHFGKTAPDDSENMKSEYENLSVYYNLDNGSGKIRGVYLEGNDAVRPLFRSWLAPFNGLGAATLSSQPTFGTDHQAFDAIGLPAFQFIQDPLDYDTRTHHSNMDVFDRAVAEDLKQASAVMAAFIYNSAMIDEKLPRKSQVGVRPSAAASR